MENAYVHGLEMKRGNGTLTITGNKKDNSIQLKVIDDGVGMTQDQIQTIFSQDDSSAQHSIGLCNVHKRLNLLYGTDYGIQIQSVLEEGTIVILTFPAQL